VQVHGADLAALDDVAIDIVAASALIEINAQAKTEELAVVVEPDAVGAMVVADRLPAAGPAAGVGAARVFHFQVAVPDAVVFQGV